MQASPSSLCTVATEMNYNVLNGIRCCGGDIFCKKWVERAKQQIIEHFSAYDKNNLIEYVPILSFFVSPSLTPSPLTHPPLPLVNRRFARNSSRWFCPTRSTIPRSLTGVCPKSTFKNTSAPPPPPSPLPPPTRLRGFRTRITTCSFSSVSSRR